MQRGKEEVMCRKLIIDQMTKSMMDHERESAEMADKLSSLKSQLMLVASEDGLREKFSCVKIGRVSDVAATLQMVMDEKTNDFHMIISTKKEVLTINFENIEVFHEDPKT